MTNKREARKVSTEVPKSYILAKYRFKRKVYGIVYHFAEIMQVNTTISAEKNLAEKVQKIKPKLRVSEAFPDSTVSNIERRSGNSIKYEENASSNLTEGTIIVIERPIFTEIENDAYASRDNDFNMVSILRRTGGYLSIVCNGLKPLSETNLDK